MQGLPAQSLSGFSAATEGNPSAKGANRLSSTQNGFSAEQSSTAPFSNLPFKSQLMSAFSMQELPLEGQFLPPGNALNLDGRANNALLNGNANGMASPLTQLNAEYANERGGELALMGGAVAAPLNAAIIHTTKFPGQGTAQGAAASQLLGQSYLQQAMLAKQFPISNAGVDGNELAALHPSLQLGNMPQQEGSAQLSNLLRDAMFKQPLSTSGGAEAKIADSFSGTLVGLATLSSEAKGGSETKALMQSSINTPFAQQAAWGEEMGSRIKWMVNSQVQNAELRMNPAHLGPIEVKITVQNDQTTIAFTAQSSSVREALDSAIPRLREMLGENGMNQVDVDVSDQQSSAQQQASAEERESMAGHGQEGVSEEGELSGADATEEGTMMLSSRMVDYYA